MTRWTVSRKRADGDRAGHRSRAASTASRQFVIEESLGYLVNRAARVMAQQLAEELRPAGVAIGQWAILLFLWAQDSMSQAELARVVAIEPPTVVRTVDRMVRDGLVERLPDPNDGRITRIHLTERGRALRDQLVSRADEVNERNLARFSPDERRRLLGLLTRIGQLD